MHEASGDFCDRPLEAEGAEAPRSHARFRLFFSLPQKLYIRMFFLNVPVVGFRLFHFSDQLILCGNSVGGGGGVLDDSWSVGRAEAFEHTGRGKLLGDELGVSEGRGACQAADCRREKQEQL